jgi:hypothetical protein
MFARKHRPKIMRENGAQCAEVQEEIAISSGCSVHRAEDNQLGMICERSDFHGAKLSLRLREGLDLGTAGSTGVLVLREEEKFGSAHSSQRSSILHAPKLNSGCGVNRAEVVMRSKSGTADAKGKSRME